MGPITISRALLLALAAACAAAHTPLSAAGDDNDCALYLTGPGRTSAYDYSLNLLKGNFGYEGQHTCITYDAVNQAYLEARNRIVVSQPKGDWKAEDFASAGELILDISINLARRYGLTYEEIEKGLPLIDTSRTLIRDICPPVFSHVECRAGKYRRLDGLCNNLEHPTWGATMAPFQRLIGPLFSDGINAPRISHTGRDLPLSRVVSRTMHPDDGFHDHAGTVMVIAWGQFMDHDYTLTGTPLDPLNRNDPEECCKRPPHLKHPYCNEIRIPDDDYFYRLWNVKCIDFVRAFPSPRPGCRLGSRVPFNTLTGVLDGNTVYGVTDKFARKLRTGYGGLLRMNPVFKEYGLKDLLPLKLDIPDEGCTRPNKNMYCFEAGEIRVNEQLVLTVMHTLMAREHNRVAEGLAQVNPHWDDETLYQEARRINIAEIQHITYNEFLPILLGKDVMEKFGLVLEKEGYWDGYDPNVNPDVIDSFASAAYRFGHSLLPTAVERWSKAHKFIASKRLSDLIRRPYDLYRAGVLDEYVMGLMNQVAQAMDDSITQEVTNHLFKKVGARFGMDLVSFNMQRGREFGIPGYMEFRKFCGLAGADSFQDLFGSMPNETVRKYETIFEHPIDVDLWSGGVSERPLPGSMLGPTFACVIATQFSYSKRGDRFWYELPNQPSSFTPEQLTEIRKARLARVICDNTDIIDTVQLYPMVLPDHELNPRVPCRSGIIPSIDFSKWAEPAPFHGGAKPFVTDAFILSKNEPEEQLDKTKENANSTTTEQQNETVDSVVESPELITAQIAVTTICDNANATMNCTDGKNNCTQCQTKLKETHGSDTIMKYVYKTGDKVDATKTSSHSKNSLKRRKRSAVYPADNSQYADSSTLNNQHAASATLNNQYAASAPLIVNYETSHGPQSGRLRQTPNIVRGAHLADYNIETTHGRQLEKNLEKIKNKAKKFDAPPNLDESDELNNNDRQSDRSEERSDYTNKDRDYSPRNYNSRRDGKPYNEKDTEKNEDDSKSNERYRNRKHSREIDDSEEMTVHNSEESYEKASNNSPYKEKARSDETREYRERESDESKERYDTSRKSSPYQEKDDSGEKNSNDYRSKESDESKEIYRPNKQNGPYKGDDNSEERSDYRNKEPTESKEKYSVDRKNGPHTDSENSDEKGNYRERYSSNSKERYEDKNDSKSYPESRENDDYKEKEKTYPPSRENYDSREKDYPRSDKASYSTPAKDSNESREQSEESYPRQESKEKYSSQDDRSVYSKPSNEDSESNEKRNDRTDEFPIRETESIERGPVNERSNVRASTEPNESEEEEAIIAIMKKKKKPPPTTPRDAYEDKSAPIIKDVDLADFTYETIHVNNEGQVEPIKETHENYDNPPTIAPLTTYKPEIIHVTNEQLLSFIPGSDVPLKFDNIENNNQQTPIDDVEVKPVVEINTDKEESVEENSKEALKRDSNEDTSLETFLGIKESNSDEKSDKIVEVQEKSEQDKGDVKQQFERIPLNYNHAKKQEEEQNKDETEHVSPKTTAKPETDETQPDDFQDNIKGTLDIITPRYDEHLNIKFDDVAIKLPEIKLPDDILSIPHDDDDDTHSYKKYNEKQKEPKKEHFYHYNEHEYNPQEPHGPVHKAVYDHEDIRNHDDADDHVYHDGYYGKGDKKKSDYKKKSKDEDDDDDDQEEDLYEKFVRERFGKKGSFEQRSEKLQAPRPSEENDKLFKSLHLVLNKAKNIEQEAKKSGDPNAGYLWTVEYGKNL